MPIPRPYRQQAEKVRDGGFTVTEMLVAAVLLAILGALLYSALTSYRGSSDNAICVSNLRKLGAAIHLYAGEHDGFLPPAVFKTAEENRGTLEEILEPYVGPWIDKNRLIAADTFYCPANVRLGSPPKEGYQVDANGVRRYKGWSGYMFGYTINASIHRMITVDDPTTPPVKLSAVRGPSHTFSLADLSPRGSDGRIPAKEFTSKTQFDPSNTQSTWFGGVHNGWCNFLFVDGHVDRFHLPRPLPVSSLPQQESPWFP